jgi:hypothetical protein
MTPCTRASRQRHPAAHKTLNVNRRLSQRRAVLKVMILALSAVAGPVLASRPLALQAGNESIQ